MSRDNSPDITRDLQTVRLFLTEPHPCSYLVDQRATTAFVDPEIIPTASLAEQLAENGFRRSGRYHYRPHCESCQACVSVRIPVAAFTPNRSQRRCAARNSDIEVVALRSIAHEQHYPLYERYISARHSDGDMYPATPKQFEDFLGRSAATALYIELRLAGRLVGCAVTDRFANGLSAIYTYFEPELQERGLGRFAILAQLQLARRWQCEHLYLGYWIAGSDKMAYKASYRPLEYFDGQLWGEPPSP